MAAHSYYAPAGNIKVSYCNEWWAGLGWAEQRREEDGKFYIFLKNVVGGKQRT